jgi:hypothetical protein
LHTHSNKSTLDSISSAGSGQVITPQERTDLEDNADARHTHPNKSTLDALSSAGSGDVITNDERSILNPTRSIKTSDFTVSAAEESTMLVCDTSVNSQPIVVTLPDDATNFGNFWHTYFMLKGGYELSFSTAVGASYFAPSGASVVAEEFVIVTMIHFNEGGNSAWYGGGRLVQ